ncbi:hypothetical protein A1QO_03865 [Vibrio genomosp. F10 str. ZF-129]|uniref:Uncharacterized protein n=1 Tax=Vibrio genomosp. F10 str. ZF-129 TaxID=1187848 RepID=A0A1E5BII2_9VIBR|nr:hypothetical protein [Vibrio genomosp. F10]OEE37249.1 hypothetical protein A1QO_03865 [Vibrio genomosp. F10 str. ZF-129]
MHRKYDWRLMVGITTTTLLLIALTITFSFAWQHPMPNKTNASQTISIIMHYRWAISLVVFFCATAGATYKRFQLIQREQ